MKIRIKDVMEHDAHHFCAFASELGLPPTDWPQQILTEIGNGMPLQQAFIETCDGELVSATYAQISGCIQVKIFND